MGDQVTQKMKKAEILNTFFALIFTNKSGNKRGIPGSRRRPGGNVEQGLFVLERRSKQGILKQTGHLGPDGMHPWVLREMAL